MRSVSGKEVARLLEARGWRLLRANGSHHIYGKDGERARLSVPIHGTTPLKRGLLHSLLRAGGLDEQDLG